MKFEKRHPWDLFGMEQAEHIVKRAKETKLVDDDNVAAKNVDAEVMAYFINEVRAKFVEDAIKEFEADAEINATTFVMRQIWLSYR